jgi:hypothetical protein
MIKYKIINKTFSTLRFLKVGTIPARGYIIVDKVPNELRTFQKNNQIDIKKVSV